MALPPATEIKAHFHILATFKSITECLSLWPQQFLRTGSLDEGCDLSVLCSKPGRYTLCLFLPKLASYRRANNGSGLGFWELFFSARVAWCKKHQESNCPQQKNLFCTFLPSKVISAHNYS